MDLINKVEIAYFRSIYKAKLEALDNVSILFGRNDSGKSNVLRALNLFFNNKTNPGQVFNIDRDFCHARLAETEDAADTRKFVYVKIWFNTPVSWKRSLGDEFWVKKQWSVTRQSDPETTSSVRESSRQQFLTRLLNKIKFHYVPAIKDRRIFEHLQGEIYKVISSHEEFAASLTEFASALRERTSDLTSGIARDLDLNSVISPPNDLIGLFHSLDFETNTEQGDLYSLTLQHGDGIQVRHIPEILAFISDRSTEDFHLWGFEEPENSLELANAIDESKRFCAYGNANNKQIFLTSHSPAFFALEESNVKRFFVSRSEKHIDRLTSKINFISDNDEESPSELMGETPHLPVISTYLREAHERIVSLENNSEELAEELAHRNRSIVFVEGESDKIILTAAWAAFVGEEPQFDFESASGTTKMESLSKNGKIINRLAPERKVFAIVDNDSKGRDLYKNKRLNQNRKWVKHNSNGVYWCRLPFAEHFSGFMNKIGAQKEFWPGSLENLFPPEIKQEAEREGAHKLTTNPHDELLDSRIYSIIQPFLTPREDLKHYYILKIDHDIKVKFSEWIRDKAQTDQNILNPLKPVIEQLKDLL